MKTLNRLSESKLFIKFDLKNIYYRIRIKSDDKWKTKFRTRYEHFEYQIILFKLANTFTIFQIYINKAMRKLVNVICVIYLNNILIYNENSTKHWCYMKQMLERLRDYQLYINLKKCQFDAKEIEVLKFIISIDEI